MRKSIHEEPYIALRLALITARTNAGLSQTTLAGRLGRPQSYVAKYETGDRRLDVVEFVEVCRAIGTDPHSLVRTVATALEDK